jgi:hypothetical protein
MKDALNVVARTVFLLLIAFFVLLIVYFGWAWFES